MPGGILGMKGTEEVDMVEVTAELFHFEAIALFELLGGGFDELDNGFGEKSLSILYRKNDVIVGLISTVVPFVDGRGGWHTSSGYLENQWFSNFPFKVPVTRPRGKSILRNKL